MKSAAKKTAAKKTAAKKTARRARASLASVGIKMRLKAGMRVRVIGGPAERLGALPAGVHETDGPGDAAVLFVQDAALLAQRFDDAARALTGPRVLWVCYPKGGGPVPSDLNRDVLWRTVAKHGFRPAAQIAVDATWTAMRFTLSAR